MPVDLEALALVPGGRPDRKRIEGAREKTLEAAVATADTVAIRREDRSRGDYDLVARRELNAAPELEVVLVRPPTDAVVRSIEVHLRLNRVTAPHRVPLAAHVAVVRAAEGLPAIARALPVDSGETAPLAAPLVHQVEIGFDRLGKPRLDARADEIRAAASLGALRLAQALGNGEHLVFKPIHGLLPPHDARAPVVLVARAVGEARGEGREAMAVVADAEVARRVEVVEPKDVERRGFGHVEPDGRHVCVERTRPVARSAVDENAVKPAESAQVLAADLEIEKAVKDTHALDVEIVEDDLARPRGRAVRRAAIPAKLIGDAPVERPGAGRTRIALKLCPDARTEAHVVPVARLAEAERAKTAVRIPGDVVHYLLTNTKVRACVEAKPRVVGLLNNGFRCSRCRDGDFRSSRFRSSGFRGCGLLIGRRTRPERSHCQSQEDKREQICMRHGVPFLLLWQILYQISPHGERANTSPSTAATA